jgi:isopentenyl diphosphate isomerase/L-lactate dehydrogenase-like FMN-dependent dehydrogenase
MIAAWDLQLRGAMFLTGSRTLADLQHEKIHRTERR